MTEAEIVPSSSSLVIDDHRYLASQADNLDNFLIHLDKEYEES